MNQMQLFNYKSNFLHSIEFFCKLLVCIWHDLGRQHQELVERSPKAMSCMLKQRTLLHVPLLCTPRKLCVFLFPLSVKLRNPLQDLHNFNVAAPQNRMKTPMREMPAFVWMDPSTYTNSLLAQELLESEGTNCYQPILMHKATYPTATTSPAEKTSSLNVERSRKM